MRMLFLVSILMPAILVAQTPANAFGVSGFQTGRYITRLAQSTVTVTATTPIAMSTEELVELLAPLGVRMENLEGTIGRPSGVNGPLVMDRTFRIRVPFEQQKKVLADAQELGQRLAPGIMLITTVLESGPEPDAEEKARAQLFKELVPAARRAAEDLARFAELKPGRVLRVSADLFPITSGGPPIGRFLPATPRVISGYQMSVTVVVAAE